MRRSPWTIFVLLATLDRASARLSQPQITHARRQNTESPSNDQALSNMTYPTTISNVWSTTSVIVGSDRSRIVVLTVTSIEYWSSAPPDYLYNFTMVETVIFSTTTLHIDGTTTKQLGSKTETATSTWILWDTSATDLPVHNPPDCNPGCRESAMKPDEICLQAGHDTACLAQCDIRNWVWWCFKRNSASTDQPAMGRVCSNGQGMVTEELYEPCDAADHRADCSECSDPFPDGGWQGYSQ